MNILFLSLLDFSSLNERGIYTDLLREFVKHGHNVSVISPVEKKYQKETSFIYGEGYSILKLRIGNIQKTNIVEKGLSTIQIESQFIKGIKKFYSNVKFDLVLYSTPPITFLNVIKFVKKRDGAATYLLLKDIFPQNSIDLGMLTTSGFKGYIFRYFRKIEQELFLISDFIGCISRANVDYVLTNNPGVLASKIEVCPNSIEPYDSLLDSTDRANIKKRYGIPIEKTLVIYGGNLGKPQGVDFLIDCLRKCTQNPKVFFVVVGSGTEYYKINNFVDKEQPPNLMLIPHLPKEEYENLANSSDIGLIFLDKRFTIPNFPSRILSYMNARIPVLAATDKNTDIGKVIEEGEFGYWCESNDAELFNDRLNLLLNSERRFEMGKNARYYLENYYTANHSYEIIMKHFT